MKHLNWQRELLAVFSLEHNSGRAYLSGILDWLADDLDWKLHVVEPERFSVSDVRGTRNRTYDGIILSMAAKANVMSELSRSSIPTVLVNIEDKSLSARETNLSSVWTDNADMGKVGAEHLFSQGEFKSFAFVHADTRQFSSREREMGFRNRLQALGVRSSAFAPAPEDPKALVKWLKGLPKPAAVMAATDQRAIEILCACQKAALPVPDAISILGVDDGLSCSKKLPVTLSSVNPNFARVGFLAMRELDKIYSSRGRRPYHEIVVPAAGVSLRASTKPALSAARLVSNALDFIDANVCRRITPSEVAAHLGKSRRLTELRFMAIRGETVRQAIERLRLERARTLLARQSGDVKAVAEQLQFRSANALSRIFKRHFGQTITDHLRRGSS